jgi:cyclic pyranopterin phosphate synthase
MVKMVDISDKDIVKRVAVAEGSLTLKPSTLKAISSGGIKKGDVKSASKLAGIQAAKATSSILPLCHQVPLTSVEIDIQVGSDRLNARCEVSAEYRTGVEMEALAGVTVALLNAWDMVKYLEKDSRGQYPNTKISDVKVISKEKGGK